MIDYTTICRVAKRVSCKLPRGAVVDSDDLAQEAALRVIGARGKHVDYRYPMFDLLRREGLTPRFWGGRAGCRYRIHHTRVPLDECSSYLATTFMPVPMILPRLQRALDGLPPRLRRVLQSRYWEGADTRAIAEEFGITRARISQLHAEAIQQLRRSIQ